MKIYAQRWWSILAILVVTGLLAGACSPGGVFPQAVRPVSKGSAQVPATTPSLTPFQPSPQDNSSETSPTQTLPAESVPAPSPAQNQLPSAEGTKAGVWVAAYIPRSLSQSLALPEGVKFAAVAEDAVLRLEVGEHNILSRWIYALVAPFPTIPTGVSGEELRLAWGGSPSATFPGEPLLMAEDTYGVFEAAWGPAGAGAVEIYPADELVDRAWLGRPAWGIVPFDGLEPRWKVLEVDGMSPLRKEFDPATYPLAVSFSFNSVAPEQAALADDIMDLSEIPGINRDAGKMTTLAMTGVTALVRCTAYTMEQRGVTYPGQDVGEILRSADITHISNEVPFAQGCPFPSCTQPGLTFCSDPKYIDLLIDVGADIVELTGDHFADWGPEAMHLTLELYRERELPYYGGGVDLEEGRRPVVLEHNGNRLAFIGCNGKGGGYATASDTNPGAVLCDFEYMHAEVTRLRREGYLPIATFQHYEYYTYLPQPNLQADFRGMAEAGAVIVSGSQAHQPHGMEFMGEAFLHYGLGNLFFDQFGFCPNLGCDDAFIDWHVFYDGRYIGTDLLPIKFVDWARPRPMTPAESDHFLQKIFSASGW